MLKKTSLYYSLQVELFLLEETEQSTESPSYSAARKFVNPLEFSLSLHKCDLKCVQTFI